MVDVFISDVEEDEDVTAQIARGLEEAGYTTWYYGRDSLPGPAYLSQVAQAIDQSRVVVIVISPYSLGSNQVTNEVVRAYESNKNFIPVLCGITHTKFQKRQPVWRQCLGATTSVQIARERVADVMPRIIAGLESLGHKPKQPRPSNSHEETVASSDLRQVERRRSIIRWWMIFIPLVLLPVLIWIWRHQAHPTCTYFSKVEQSVRDTFLI